MKPADFLEPWLRGRRANVGLVIAIIGVVLVPQTCRSELIYFRKGGEAQLPVRLEGDRVIVAMPDGDITKCYRHNPPPDYILTSRYVPQHVGRTHCPVPFLE